MSPFVRAFQGEWIKQRRSLASWMIVAGSLFTPAVVTVARLLNPGALGKTYASDAFWTSHWKSSWESMAIFFLPMGAILAASLVAQIEFRNNAWKQVHALPLGIATIFFSKLAVVLVLMVEFFALFNAGIYLSGVVPGLLLGVNVASAPLPYARFLRADLLYFVDCLPIVGAQYMISLRAANFLVPVGAGFLAWVAALAALPWKLGYVVPYSYTILHYLSGDARGKAAVPPVNIHWLALAYFVAFTLLGFVLFATRQQKG